MGRLVFNTSMSWEVALWTLASTKLPTGACPSADLKIIEKRHDGRKETEDSNPGKNTPSPSNQYAQRAGSGRRGRGLAAMVMSLWKLNRCTPRVSLARHTLTYFGIINSVCLLFQWVGPLFDIQILAG